MQAVTPPAQHQAAVTLSLAMAVTGSPQALSRLKAKLELSGEDVLQDLTQQASNELGIEIGLCNIETSISQPVRDGSASSCPPESDSAEPLGVPSESAFSAPLKTGSCL